MLYSGNIENHLPDRYLTSTVLVKNLLDNENKHIIFSTDSDLVFYNEVFVNEILPEYFADTIIDTLIEKNYFRKEFINNKKQFSKKVQDYMDHYKIAIKYAFINYLNNVTNEEKTSISLIYDPCLSHDSFSNTEVPVSFKRLFQDINTEDGKENIVSKYDSLYPGDFVNALIELYRS